MIYVIFTGFTMMKSPTVFVRVKVIITLPSITFISFKTIRLPMDLVLIIDLKLFLIQREQWLIKNRQSSIHAGKE